MYIHKYVNITYSVSIMLIVCVLSGFTIWYWIINWCTLPWERLFSVFSAFIICL